MTDREQLITSFLTNTPWRDWSRTPLAGDASNRRYERLHSDDGRAVVLMDAPPDQGEDVAPFVQIAAYLRKQGLSAPEVLAEDHDHGFLMIEDLGDALFTRVMAKNPKQEQSLYEAATDVLITLHNAPMPELEPLGPRLMAELSGLVFEKYRDVIQNDQSPDHLARFTDQFEDILRGTTKGDVVLVQRDYHAENLIWLPEREGIARVGLLDFQAARAGHRAYDLVSMLQDARRDVPAAIEMQMIDRYIAATGVNDSSFRAAYAVLGVQRNLRILGVFARLSCDYGKPQYVDLIPRVWDHFRRGLDHPAMAPLAEFLHQEIQAPTPDVLDRLRG
ncbi:aminoglycoside phosphotransferase family protein [Phaeobacter porticola]|uniref:Putative phosphotransferase n=1 Tax=Phaeobacter porticola TaxID=1844006 RepID=A0A1L3I9M2_9RHOB|nr:phosphotransferase [Phaeobacter porticola]APG48765.1 putative phosphotransferase [Phaeobacter porticola]